MDPSTWTVREWMTYGPLLNAGIGVLFGLIPLVLGLVKGKAKYGLYGILACIIGGALLGIFLILPATVFFSWMILRGDKAAVGAQEIDSGFEN